MNRARDLDAPLDLALSLALFAAAVTVCPLCEREVPVERYLRSGCDGCNAELYDRADACALAARDHQMQRHALLGASAPCIACERTGYVRRDDGMELDVCGQCAGAGFVDAADVALVLHECDDRFPDAEALIARHDGVAEPRARYARTPLRRGLPARLVTPPGAQRHEALVRLGVLLPPPPETPPRPAQVRCGVMLPPTMAEGEVAS